MNDDGVPEGTDTARLAARLRTIGDEHLPLPGGGATVDRHRLLWGFAVESPSIGRLAEAHFDAVAILAEAGRDAPRGATFGVWAAEGPHPLLLGPVRDDGTSRLRGEKQWCSGASLVSHALVTCRRGDADVMLCIDMTTPGVTLGTSAWRSDAFRAIDTRTVCFDVEVTEPQIVGPAGWYLARPGFWHGAVGVAACWAGAGAGRVTEVMAGWRPDPHAAAHLGAVDARVWEMRALLDAAAIEIDANPGDVVAAHRRALQVRHLVDVAVADISDRIGRALGPRPYAFNPGFQTRMAEVDLYRRQCHAERDLQRLGELVADRARG